MYTLKLNVPHINMCDWMMKMLFYQVCKQYKMKKGMFSLQTLRDFWGMSVDEVWDYDENHSVNWKQLKLQRVQKFHDFVKIVDSPLHPRHTELQVSLDPETLRSPAEAPGSPPRSWSRPQCVSADCGDFHPQSAGKSGPELWSCLGCARPEKPEI